MQQKLDELHKELSAICGEICWALTLRRIVGGKTAIKRWARVLKTCADICDTLSHP